MTGGRIDAHCHYWTLAREDYDWLTPDLEPIYRDFGAADHDAASVGLGVAQRVLVQAAPTVAETEFLLDCATADVRATGVVGWVDLSSPDAASDLERLAADPLFKGVRPMLQDIAEPDWIVTRPGREAVAKLTELGLRFDALAKPAQIDAVLAFARANPDLPVVIDHAAKPDLSLPDDAPERAQWARAMAELAALPRVCCKLSGLLNEMPPENVTTPAATARFLAPVLDQLLGWFGANRIAWGSDWPVVNLAADYGFWAKVTDALISPLSDAERADILSGTATRFYGLEPTR
ncbi:amidohydrolase family protein [Pelagibacterium xiamenense]|uniref:amidohydrolase family protein n=1 Tax=Pelagibacterium xiamenense TaxID=2901140 RepID=UPI001E4110A9|nr:amidohydrolase family protein [Pelagibacterium xiamenense]MCD7058955.1 amidohydrolase family protein [Pelagibacterium xiamenense]